MSLGERPVLFAHFFKLSSRRLLVTVALTDSKSCRILVTSSSANAPENVSAMVGFLNCCIDHNDIMGMAAGGMKFFMFFKRSEVTDPASVRS